MEAICQSLHSLLVEMGYQGVSPEREHQMAHLLALLSPDDEALITRYYGLFGHERASLSELAHERQLDGDTMLSHIEKCLRRIAVSPEWQWINN